MKQYTTKPLLHGKSDQTPTILETRLTLILDNGLLALGEVV